LLLALKNNIINLAGAYKQAESQSQTEKYNPVSTWIHISLSQITYSFLALSDAPTFV